MSQVREGAGVKILIACEESGTVRDAFIKKGHDAISCDIIPTSSPGPHIQGDIQKEIISNGWQYDIMIAFPPCTHLAVSGARWFEAKRADGRQQAAIAFFMSLVNAPINKIAIENPIGILSTHYRKPDQIIQPWQFGHGETKATCLWLKNLPKLKPTNIVEGREARIHKMAPSENRSRLRSITYQGFADAMADQWG
jgi:site-specific DNA-cytosine methylase